MFSTNGAGKTGYPHVKKITLDADATPFLNIYPHALSASYHPREGSGPCDRPPAMDGVGNYSSFLIKRNKQTHSSLPNNQKAHNSFRYNATYHRLIPAGQR